MRSWSLPLLLMAVSGASPPERPSDDNPPERQAHQAVQRGIGFLEKEGLAWMRKQQCASCHHIPLMVWALNEARGRGFQVDEKALGEVTSWALAEGNQEGPGPAGAIVARGPRAARAAGRRPAEPERALDP